jgi:hypothetical protein
MCFRRALENRPDLKGKIAFKLVIDSAGRVTKIDPDKEAKRKNAFERCMLQKLKKLHFAASKGGKKSMVLITFVLK